MTVKELRVLWQQCSHQSGDGQHREGGVLTDSGQTVEESSGHSDTEPTDGTV